ncbi:MAG: hypothetical protein HUJ76_11065, partial [Parasporobacterium sp.]|nr:hypothetical protein [Parasporobacterium sp.]
SGAAAVSTNKKGVGGSLQVDILKKKVDAIIGSGTSVSNHLTAKVKGNTTVNADAKETAYSIAVGLAGSTDWSVSGSVLVLYNSDEVISRIGDFVFINYDKEGGDITVKAHDNIYQLSLAGELGFSNGSWAAGLANEDTILKGTVKAEVGKAAYLKGNNILISADSENELYQIAVAGNASSSGVVNGSVVGTDISQTTHAIVHSGSDNNNGTLDAANDITIKANNNSTVANGVGTIGFTLGSAGGGGIDAALFKSDTLAQLGKGVTAKAGGSVSVAAGGKGDFKDVCVGVEVSTGSGIGTVSGCLVVVSREDLVRAIIGDIIINDDPKTSADYQADAAGTNVSAGGSVLVNAENNSSTFALAGDLGITTGTAGFAAGVVVVTNENLTWAEIGKEAVVTANGSRPVSAALGGLEITPASAFIENNGLNISYKYKKAKRENKSYNGVVVGSYMNNVLNIIALAASGSATAAITPASAVLNDTAITIARINTAAKVNQGSRESGAKASVHVVSAGDTTDSVSDGTVGVSGSFGISGTVTVYVGTKETVAEVLSSNVYAEGDIEVSALSVSDVSVLGAGAAGGGTAGGGASASAISFDDTTKSKVSGTFESKEGSISVLSNMEEDLDATAICVAGAGTGGIGFTVVAAIFTGKTISEVGPSSTFDAKGNINIAAQSDEKINTTAAGGAVGGVGALEGTISVDIINITTQAIIDDSTASSKGSFKASGDVVVKALDNSALVSKLGAVTGAGTAAVGAAVQVAVYRGQVSAIIGAYNDITGKTVTVLAGNNREVD